MNFLNRICDWLFPEPEPFPQLDQAALKEMNRAINLCLYLVAILAQEQGLDFYSASEQFNALSESEWLRIFSLIPESPETLTIEGAKDEQGMIWQYNRCAPPEDLDDYREKWSLYAPYMRYFAEHRKWPSPRYLDDLNEAT